MIRYCDDFVICVEREDDAEEILQQLEQRLGKGELRLSSEKTRIVKFKRPDDSGTDADTDTDKYLQLIRAGAVFAALFSVY